MKNNINMDITYLQPDFNFDHTNPFGFDYELARSITGP